MAASPKDPPVARVLADEELPAAARVVSLTMLGSVTDEIVDQWAEFFTGATTHGTMSAEDDVVGVARWFPTKLSLDGGAVDAAGVTAVAVATTHRRQGHLSSLMRAQLTSIAEADVPMALLVAAEWPIYGRFGYGPAIDACAIEIDSTTAVFVSPRSGSISLASPTAVRADLEAVHDLRWERTMGAITRDARTWDRVAGVKQWPGDTSDAGKARAAVWRNDAGEVHGVVSYAVKDDWKRNRPAGVLQVGLLLGATPEAERELWRHLCDVDWATTIRAGNRSLDDPVHYLFTDGRAAVQLDTFDCIWARVMDVPAVLSNRRAPLSGRSVIEVVDDLGFANGRWAIELGPDGAEVKASEETAEVRIPVAALSAASLGGRSLTQLHEAGWLDEERPGGVARLDALLRSPTAPWSPTTY